MILTLDTSLADLSIGLFSEKGEVIANYHRKALPDERGIHDSLLAQKTSELLVHHSISAKEISRIAVIIGPGSFTGLRIGLSFAKGFAFGSGAQITPLIAHEVLLKSYTTGPEPDTLGIIYPGYETGKAYFALAKAPKKIEYTGYEEILKSTEEIITPEPLEDLPEWQHIIPLDHRVMAEMAIAAESVSLLADLEPFYGSDFKVKAGKSL